MSEETDLPFDQPESSIEPVAELDIVEDFGVDIDDDLSDSLPDWFSMESQESSSTGQTGWLRSLEEIDVGSWLAAEEETTGTTIEEDMGLSNSGETLPTLTADAPLLSFEQQVPDLPTESYETARRDSASSVDERKLSGARTALADEKYEEAVSHYQQLVASGTGTLALIAELESLANEYPTKPAFRRLLGDAYMRNGQLQKALNTYHDALDQL